MTAKRRRTIELAMSFWAGIGLMNIINAWKITQGMHPLTYSWLMFGLAVFFVVLCLILVSLDKRK